MSIWKRPASPEDINQRLANSMADHLGIRFTEIGDDFLKATMPVDERTKQHKGILHGGASVVLAETLGSVASILCCEDEVPVVGLEINANHLRAGTPPEVTGITRPLHIGRSTMVWEIKIYDSHEKLICVSRLTAAVLAKKHAGS